MKGYAGVVQDASNIRIGGNAEDVTQQEFLSMYPQFADPPVPAAFLSMILERANDSIQEARWHKSRRFAVCLYVAHHCTLYLKTAVDSETVDPAVIAGKGESKGAVMSKSVGQISVSYGTTEGSSDLAGFGSLKDTVYGQQLASLARMVGAGMMVIR